MLFWERPIVGDSRVERVSCSDEYFWPKPEERNEKYGLLLRYEKAHRAKNFHDHDGWHVLDTGCYVTGYESRQLGRGLTYDEAKAIFEERLAEKQERDWSSHAEVMHLAFQRGLRVTQTLNVESTIHH